MWGPPDAEVKTGADLEARSGRDLAVYLSLQEAVPFNRNLHQNGLVEQLMAMRAHAYASVAERPNMQWLSPKDAALATSIYTIKVGDAKQGDLLTVLRDEHGFILRSYDREDFQGLRLSLHGLNTTDELDSFFATLDSITA
jgi:selenocysteine lyase/cysteine desulfurase